MKGNAVTFSSHGVVYLFVLVNHIFTETREGKRTNTVVLRLSQNILENYKSLILQVWTNISSELCEKEEKVEEEEG